MTSLGGVLGLGAAPGLSGGLTVQLGLRWPHFSVAMEGRVDMPAAEELADGEVSGSIFVASVVPCAHIGPAIGCGMVMGGVMRAAGHEMLDQRSVTMPYAAAGVRAGVELAVVWVLSVRLYADLLATITRINLREIDTQTILWTSPPLSGAFGLAAVATFL